MRRVAGNCNSRRFTERCISAHNEIDYKGVRVAVKGVWVAVGRNVISVSSSLDNIGHGCDGCISNSGEFMKVNACNKVDT